MPRSALSRALIRAVRRIKAARKRGVTVDALAELAVRKPKQVNELSRRRFLTGMTAGAAGFALASRASAYTQSAVTLPRIAIVGAGISGLNCALALADRGISSTLYEASNRVGGRMFSENSGYWTDNQVSENGGEEIDAEHTTIIALVQRFGLTLDTLIAASAAGETDTYYINGNYYKLSDAIADLNDAFSAIDDAYTAVGATTTYKASTPAGRRIDNVSTFNWVQANVPGGVKSRLGQLLILNAIDEYGADATDQSALNLIYDFGGGGGSEEDGFSGGEYHIQGGNDLLPKAIASYLTELNIPIRTGMAMTKIAQNSSGAYQLTFESGGTTSEVDADLVVLTLPFAVLRTLDYRNAGFDALKNTAIKQLGAARNGKLHLQFTHRLWNDAGPWGIGDGLSYSSAYLFTRDVTRAQAGESGILLNYTGGKRYTANLRSTVPLARIENPGVQLDAKNFLNGVAPIFPRLPALWNGKATQSLPHLSPFFKCSYAYRRVGQYHKITGYEGVRQKNIFFAGEHTSYDFQGFMEGGAAEGARAAGEILSQLGLA